MWQGKVLIIVLNSLSKSVTLQFSGIEIQRANDLVRAREGWSCGNAVDTLRMTYSELIHLGKSICDEI